MPLSTALIVFVLSTVVIGVVGTRLAGVVDEVADRTGIGEAIAGAVLLGAATSLSGSILSVSASLSGRADLAISNAVGGIAAQTLFLAVADVLYRRANLEHAAASVGNMMQGALLVTQMSWLLLAFAMPDWTIGHVHVVTPLLILSYLYGVRLLRQVRATPMWHPASTSETRQDLPEDEPGGASLARLLVSFGALAGTLAIAGLALERGAAVIAEETGLGQVLVGALFTAVATSLPELVTTIAAVRRGALTLAIAGIIGGNAFDTLFAGFSDLAYREGSVYQAVSGSVVIWTALGLLMTAFLLMGLIRRQQHGPGGIGFESVALIGCYAAGVGIVVATG